MEEGDPTAVDSSAFENTDIPTEVPFPDAPHLDVI